MCHGRHRVTRRLKDCRWRREGRRRARSLIFCIVSGRAAGERRLLAAGSPVPARLRSGAVASIQGRKPRAGPRGESAAAAHRRRGAAEP